MTATPQPTITHLKELSSLLAEKQFPVIALDTSFVVKALVQGLDHHKECVQFLEDLKTFQPIIIFSEFLRIELWCAHLRIAVENVRGPVSMSTREFMRLFPHTPRSHHAETVMINDKFNELLGNFENWVAIPVDDAITRHALNMIKKHNLLGGDAIHIATMLHNDLFPAEHIVAFDKHIEDIKDITVWTVDGHTRYMKNHAKEFKTKKGR